MRRVFVAVLITTSLLLATPAEAKKNPKPSTQCVFAFSFADDLVDLHRQYVLVEVQVTQAAFDRNATVINAATQQITALNAKYLTAKNGYDFAKKQCLAGK